MSNQLEIANGALIHLGAKPVLALNDNSKSSNAILLRWDPCRKAMIQMHAWKWATKRAILNPDVDGGGAIIPPTFGFDNQFTIPNDTIRLLWVNQGDSDYRYESGKILCNDSIIQLKYIYDAACDVFSPEAALALSCYLAWDICYWITQSNTLKQELWTSFRTLLATARFADATENPADQVEDDTWLNSRVGSTIGQFVRDPGT